MKCANLDKRTRLRLNLVDDVDGLEARIRADHLVHLVLSSGAQLRPGIKDSLDDGNVCDEVRGLIMRMTLITASTDTLYGRLTSYVHPATYGPLVSHSLFILIGIRASGRFFYCWMLLLHSGTKAKGHYHSSTFAISLCVNRIVSIFTGHVDKVCMKVSKKKN